MCHKLSCEVLSVRTIIIYLMFIQMVKLKFSCFPVVQVVSKGRHLRRKGWAKKSPCHVNIIWKLFLTSDPATLYCGPRQASSHLLTQKSRFRDIAPTGVSTLPKFPLPLVKSSPLYPENPTALDLDGQIFRKFTHFCLSST